MESESESLIWRRLRLRALSVLSGFLCNFVAVYLTFVRFILQPKLHLYTIVHLLLEEFKNFSLKSSSLSTQSLCHTISPRVGVGVWFWARSRSPGCFRTAESESGVLNFLTHGVGFGVPQKSIVLCPVPANTGNRQILFKSCKLMKMLPTSWVSCSLAIEFGEKNAK